MTKKLLCLAAVVLFLATPRLYAAIPPAENLLPADTLAFFAVPDCAAARLAAKSSPAWMFWEDPSMQPFTGKLAAKWNAQFIAPLEHDLGVQVANFTDLPQGQFTLAVTVNGSNGHDDIPPGLLLLLDAKGKSDLLKTNLAVLVKKWTDAGRALRTEQIHGLAFTVVPLSSNDFAGILPKPAPVSEMGKEPAKPEKPGEIYFTQFQSLLVVGNSATVVEPVAAHLTGGGAPAIADNDVFAADKLAQFRDEPQYYGWFNGKAFFNLVSQAPSGDEEAEASPFPGLSMNATFGALGLTGIKSISFALREMPAGTTLKVHVNAPEAERTGLLKMLAIAPKDASVPQFVPADAIKFSRFRLDGKQTWAEIQKMVASLSPSGEASLNALINFANSMGQQKTPGFDIRNDLLGNLGDDIISYQKPSGDNSGGSSSIYLFAVANADTMINAVKLVAGIGNPQDSDAKPREFLGHKIYSVALKPGQTAGGAQPRALYIASSGGYLALSMDSAMVEEFLRNADGQNKALRDNPGLAGALQYLGGAGGGLFGYENQRETMRGAFKEAKNAFTAEATARVFPASREWLDFSLLPDFDAVAKYFYLSAFVGSANTEGLTFMAFTPRPPQLN